MKNMLLNLWKLIPKSGLTILTLLIITANSSYAQDITTDLVTKWTFNESPDDDDGVFGTATVVGATLTTDRLGRVDSAYSFDGVDDYIEITDAPSLNFENGKSFTFALWFRCDPNHSTNRIFISKGSGSPSFTLRMRPDGTLESFVRTSTSQDTRFYTTLSYDDGEWHHAAFTITVGVESAIYVDGELSASLAVNTTGHLNTGTNMRFGSFGHQLSQLMKGDLDDIYLYDRVLTVADINSLPLFNILNVSVESGEDINESQQIEVLFNENLLASSANATNITASGSVSGPLDINITIDQDKLVVGPTLGWPLDEDVTISLSNILSEFDGTTLPNTDLIYSVVADGLEGLMLHYPISQNANEAIGDIANQDGTISGALFAEGFDGDPFGALSFDGVDDLVTLGDAPISTASFSISLWVKVPVDGSTTANTVIFSKREACVVEERMFSLNYLRSGDKFRFQAKIRDNADAGYVQTGFDFPVDEWVKVTFVKDNSAKQSRIMVNDLVEAQTDWLLGSVNVENDTPLKLGESPCVNNGEFRYDGLMDDIRIYDRAVQPRIASITPEKGALNVATDTVVTIIFDRAVDVSSLDPSAISITDDVSSYSYTTTFSGENTVLTITPDSHLPKGKQFVVSVDTLAASTGSDFLPFQTFFSTVSTQLLSHFPSNGVSDVDMSETISFKFDNTISMSSLDQGIRVIGSMHGPVEGSFAMPTTDSVVFTPSIPYFPNEIITVYVRPSLSDIGGGAIENNKAFTFHVATPLIANPTLSFELSTLTVPATTANKRDLVPADLDNDGDLDLIGGQESTGTLFWFENKGSGTYGEGQVIDDVSGTNDQSDYFDIDVTDFDFDGDLDLVIVSRASARGIYWYENDGSAAFTQRLVEDRLNASDFRAVKAADFNGDGSMDIVAVDLGFNLLSVYAGDGTLLFEYSDVGMVDVQVADMEGDGDLDLYVANLTTGNVTLFENNGAASFTSSVVHTVSQVRAVIPIDFDKDGDIDIVYSAQSASQIGILENNGDLTYTNHQVGSVAGPQRIDVGDIEGDGDFDIIYTVTTGASDINFFYLENNGSFGLWVAKKLIETETFTGASTQTAKFADIDNDGDLDVLAVDTGNGFYIFENKIIDNNLPPAIVDPITTLTLDEDSADSLIVSDLNMVFSDPESDAITYTVVADTSAVTVTIVNDTTVNLNLAANYHGVSQVTITATDTNGGATEMGVAVTVTSVNDQPIVANPITEFLLNEDQGQGTINLANMFSDVEDEMLTYSFTNTNGAVDVSLDEPNQRLVLDPIADANGDGVLTILATDSENAIATNEIQLSVAAVNDAPVLSVNDIMVDEDFATQQTSVVDIAQPANEADQTVTVSVSPDPATIDWAVIAFDEATNTFAVDAVADGFGSQVFTITADDGQSANNTASVDITIAVSALNDAPNFELSTNQLTLGQDFAGTETITLTDLSPANETELINYSLSPASVAFANVSIDEMSGEISVTAVIGEAGSQVFTITADDGSATASDQLTIEILSNQAPVIVNTIMDMTYDEDAGVQVVVSDFTVLFSDPDGDDLSYTVASDNTEIEVSLVGNTIEVVASADYFGSGKITLTASDATLATDLVFNVEITAVNDAPFVANAVADQVSLEDANFSYQLPANVFDDVDGDNLELIVSGVPTWMNFDGLSRFFTASPTNDEVGVYTISLEATDGILSATDEFTITIENVNDAPTVTNTIADQTLAEDAAPISFDLSTLFEDVDGDVLTYTLQSSVVDAASAVISGSSLSITPLADASGTGNIQVEATDGMLSTSQTFNVNITAVNDAPAFTLSETSLSMEANFATQAITITADPVPADEADQIVTYSLTPATVDFATLAIDATTGEVTIASIAGESGQATVTVVADDGQNENNTFEASFDLTVAQVLSANEDFSEGLQIYPNPVAHTLTIALGEAATIRLINLDGSLLLEKVIQQGSLDLTAYPDGIYLLQIELKDEMITRKIMKKN